MLVLSEPRPVSMRQRQRLVDELVRTGVQRPADVLAELHARGVVNRRGRPFSLSTIRNDVRAANVAPVKEIIGRVATAAPLWRHGRMLDIDKTQPHYEFWDELRRGKAEGFKFGGLFAMPLTQIIASFVFGSGVTAALADSIEASEDQIEHTNELLARFLARNHRMLLGLATDVYGLGDQYVAVNADGSTSLISPELVEIETDEQDYRTYKSIKVTTRLDKYTIEDVFTLTGRTVTVYQGYTGRGAKAVTTQTFNSLTGMLPIVHFPNDRGTNELYGRPVYEALYRLFSRYDDLIEKAIDGAEIMGNPIPVFEGMENVKETIAANSTQSDETYTDLEGNTETRQVLRWDRLSTVFVGKGGAFNFKAPPGGFTDDIRNMLKSLFLLMLDYTRVPEVVWGGAINSSKASADAQMPPFFQYIEGRRLALEGDGADELLGFEAKNGLYQLLDLWLRTKALTDPQVVVGPVVLKWPELDTENWETLLKWVTYLRGIGLLDDETTLQQFGQLDDPAAVLEKAKEEAEERKEDSFEFQQRLGMAQDSANQDEQTAPGDESDEDTPPDDNQRAPSDDTTGARDEQGV